MKCQEVTELMQRDLDKDLNDIEHEQLHMHLQQCASCKSMYERMQVLSAELEQLPKVSPPYSIVDSILPALQRLDIEGSDNDELHTQANPQDETATSSHKAGWKAYWTKRNWSMVGGVIAAGLAFGLIFVNFGLNEKSMEQADGYLQPNSSTANKVSELATIESEISNNQAIDKKSATGGAASTAPQASVDQAGQERELLSAAGQTQMKDVPRIEEPVVLEKQIIDQMGEERNAPAYFDGPSDTLPQEAAIQGQGIQSIAPSSGGTGEISNSAVPDSMVTAEKAPLAPVDQGMGGIFSIADVNHMEQNDQKVTELVSPEGVYVAKVEGLTITIYNADQKVEYQTTSKMVDHLQLLNWSSDGNLLIYETLQGNTVTQYEINIKAQTDIKIES